MYLVTDGDGVFMAEVKEGQLLWVTEDKCSAPKEVYKIVDKTLVKVTDEEAPKVDAIEIVFKNGDVAHYMPDEYTDYKYDGKYFIVILEKQWIGFYNLDAIEYIEVYKG